jgi:lipopolysaccharide/colanic/teichoic acid biosynthesis glycosyltransferase
MQNIRQNEYIVLLIGDILILFTSLVLTVVIRNQAFSDHIWPFSILFVFSIVTFFIAGLYEQHTVFFKKKLSQVILRSQIANAVMAIALFYFVPFFNITPKVNLFLYLLISLIALFAWRLYGLKVFNSRNDKNNAVIIGEGKEADELTHEINNNNRYPFKILRKIQPEELTNLSSDVSMIILDDSVKYAQSLYPLIIKGVQCIELTKLYEQIFERIPLSLVNESWLIRNISVTRRYTYNIIKRVFDIVVAFCLGIVPIVCFPFIYILVKLEDGGPIFISQNRVGRNGKIIRIYKFRSMTSNDNGKYGKEGTPHKVTKVGDFLRKSRLDEFAQLYNVLVGDISLVGPRPEFPALVAQYEEKIPYYGLRHIVQPGLSGWAQIYHEQHPHHAVDVEETRNKLSYDLYYIKHRSLVLELTIALRTVRILLSKSGI